MAKRIVTKIGDVFCAELGDGYKGYFQYVAIDKTMLGGRVIRVFKKRYKVDEQPTVEEILKDEVQFYAHTLLKPGIQLNHWYKVGKSEEIGIEEVKKVLFGLTNDTKEDWLGRDIDVDPRKNWQVWHLNEDEKKIGRLSNKYRDIVEYGAVLSFINILDRMKYGYYKFNCFEFDELKRIPLCDVNSYLKVTDKSNVVYYHYLGDTAVGQIILSGGNLVRMVAGKDLFLPKFHEINWYYDDFITEKEFQDEWNRVSSLKLQGCNDDNDNTNYLT